MRADGLPVEGASAVEELEVEGCGGLAVDLGVRNGHCWGLVVVIKRGVRVLIYAPILIQESATDGMSTKWTRDSYNRKHAVEYREKESTSKILVLSKRKSAIGQRGNSGSLKQIIHDRSTSSRSQVLCVQ